MWNLEKWYRGTGLQGRNRDADVENKRIGPNHSLLHVQGEVCVWGGWVGGGVLCIVGHLGTIPGLYQLVASNTFLSSSTSYSSQTTPLKLSNVNNLTLNSRN